MEFGRFAQILIRNLPDGVQLRLQRRAERNGHSLKAEVWDVLASAPEPSAALPQAGITDQLITRLARHKVSKETWEEFERNLEGLRNAPPLPDEDFGQ